MKDGADGLGDFLFLHGGRVVVVFELVVGVLGEAVAVAVARTGVSGDAGSDGDAVGIFRNEGKRVPAGRGVGPPRDCFSVPVYGIVVAGVALLSVVIIKIIAADRAEDDEAIFE